MKVWALYLRAADALTYMTYDGSSQEDLDDAARKESHVKRISFRMKMRPAPHLSRDKYLPSGLRIDRVKALITHPGQIYQGMASRGSRRDTECWPAAYGEPDARSVEPVRAAQWWRGVLWPSPFFDHASRPERPVLLPRRRTRRHTRSNCPEAARP